MFANGLGDWGFNPSSSNTKDSKKKKKKKKKVLDATLLSIQHYMVRVKWSGGIQGMEKRPPLHLGAVAFEKWAFESPSTKVADFTFYLYIYIRSGEGSRKTYAGQSVHSILHL